MNYDSVRKAVLVAGAYFRAKDLEDLYGEIEDDIIIEVAEKYNLMLPEDLREDFDDESEDEPEVEFEEEDDYFTSDQIKQELKTTIECTE